MVGIGSPTRTRRTLLACMFATLVAALHPVGAHAEPFAAFSWLDQRALGGPAGTSQDMATDSDLSSTVVWALSDTEKVIVVSTQGDNGSWSAPFRIPGSTGGGNPVIAVASNGAAVVAFERTADDHKIGVSYRPAGGQFGPTKLVGTSADSEFGNSDPAVAIAPTGRYAVAWAHVNATSRDYEIEYAMGAATTIGAAATLSSGNATTPQIGMDTSGRAIMLYQQSANSMMQSLAGASGGFGTPTVLDGTAYPPDNPGNNQRVAVAPNGAVIAGWGQSAPEPAGMEDAFAYYPWQIVLGVGSTTNGITSVMPVSNPYPAPYPALARVGATRNPGSYTEVAIDENGDGFLAWDASGSGLEAEYWAVPFVTGQVGTSAAITGATYANGEAPSAAAAGGRFLLGWTTAPEPGATASTYTAQAAAPAPAAAIGWDAPVRASAADAMTDNAVVTMSQGGRATVAFGLGAFSNDHVIAVNQNIVGPPADTTPPNLLVPRAKSRIVMRNGAILLRVTCPASEPRCTGSAIVKLAGRPATSVGRGTFNLVGGRSANVRIVVSRAIRMRVLRSGNVPVKATFKVADELGNSRTITRLLRIGAPPTRR